MRPHQNNECFGNYHFLWREVGLYDRLSKVLTKCTIFLNIKEPLIRHAACFIPHELMVLFLISFQQFLILVKHSQQVQLILDGEGPLILL
jgi:hypothetical protein